MHFSHIYIYIYLFIYIYMLLYIIYKHMCTYIYIYIHIKAFLLFRRVFLAIIIRPSAIAWLGAPRPAPQTSVTIIRMIIMIIIRIVPVIVILHSSNEHIFITMITIATLILII